jgi:methionine aminopeptidase
MENNISSKENEIKAIQKSDAWVWFHADKKMKSNLEKEILRRYNK